MYVYQCQITEILLTFALDSFNHNSIIAIIYNFNDICYPCFSDLLKNNAI